MSLQSSQSEFVDMILSDTRQDNMSIYLNNIMSKLTRALIYTYPLTYKLIGDDGFRVAAKEYILKYPSVSGNLNEYGEYFGDFLHEFDPAADSHYLKEVADFEWNCHIVSCAAEATPLDIALLETVAPERRGELHFTLNPASRLMQCRYPLLDIVDLCREDHDSTVDLNAGGVDLLIIRRELDLSLVKLTQAEYLFLSALQDNETLNSALEQCLTMDPAFQLDVKLPQWIQDKTIIDFY